MADSITDEERRERRRESVRKYTERNREKVREQRKRYRLEHKEQIAEYVRRARAADPEKFRERTRQWRAANPQKVRARNKQQVRDQMADIHGLDWRAAYAAMRATQDGRCYLCGDELNEDILPSGKGRATVIDHDHRCCPQRRSCSDCRRGLACQRCNVIIGLAGDNPEVLRRIADALEVANARISQRLAARPAQGVMF